MPRLGFFRTFVLVILIFFYYGIYFAYGVSLIITSDDISYSKEEPIVGDSIRIYAKIANRGLDDMRGIAKFFDKKQQIGSDQPFTVLKGKTADVFTDYSNLPYGERTIVVKIIPWQSSNEAISASLLLFVDRDSDKDGIPDRKDPDDDNDGVEDNRDAFPLDPTESVDTDRDGMGDNKDKDDDNDGLSDEEEPQKGTDPKKWDTDGDNINDKEDAFPLDSHEWEDSDQDGIGDNQELDDDNDGICDKPPAIDAVCRVNPDGSGDAFPKDPTETMDTDKDNIGDNRDTDDDNDGLTDGKENDFGTDSKNPDTDEDGYKDGEDVFPLDPKEWKDSDQDGLGDTADPNSNNKGPVVQAEIPEQLSLFLPYYFNASQSYDPDGNISSISWELDGKKMISRDFWYMFFTPGEHLLILQVLDDMGEGRTKIFHLNVSGILYIVVFLIALFLAVLYFMYKRGKRYFTRSPVSMVPGKTFEPKKKKATIQRKR